MAFSHPSTSQPAFAINQERILIVDDEDLIRETVALALSEEGYQVYTANSGDAALELLFPQGNGKRGSSQVDLAILDLMLPGGQRAGCLPTDSPRGAGFTHPHSQRQGQ